MTYQAITEAVSDRHSTGELCPGCDCEVIVSLQGAGLLLECDCGSVSALSSVLPSAA